MELGGTTQTVCNNRRLYTSISDNVVSKVDLCSYLQLLIAIFFCSSWQKLADVVLSQIEVVRVRATILLGELLHMVSVGMK